MLLSLVHSSERYLCRLGVLLNAQDDLLCFKVASLEGVCFAELGFRAGWQKLLEFVVGLYLGCVFLCWVLVYVVDPEKDQKLTAVQTVVLEGDLGFVGDALSKIKVTMSIDGLKMAFFLCISWKDYYLGRLTMPGPDLWKLNPCYV
jgi:hypothetical protein